MKKSIRIFALATFSIIFNSCDAASDDGTVGNWFCAIIFLLAWLKGGWKCKF